MTTETRQAPLHTILPKPATDSDDHWVCCVNANVTLCRMNASEMNYVPEMDKATCVVCDDLHEATDCPIFGECPLEEGEI